MAVAVTVAAEYGYRPSPEQVQFFMEKLHVFVPALLAVTFMILRTPLFSWKSPGPQHMFLMFGAFLAAQEAATLLRDAWKLETKDVTAWGLVFSATALAWVSLDAGKIVYQDLNPKAFASAQVKRCAECAKGGQLPSSPPPAVTPDAAAHGA
ncbi:MAG: hypothetical protein ABW061_19355 [Polyangiaceae bacterium]